MWKHTTCFQVFDFIFLNIVHNVIKVIFKQRENEQIYLFKINTPHLYISICISILMTVYTYKDI